MTLMLSRRNLGIALVAGGLSASSARAQSPHSLRIGFAASNTTMDPHLLPNAVNNAVNSHIFDSLVVNDAQSRSVPGLASSWRVLDDTHWEFALRKNVRFSDGSLFTAADAIASFRRAADMPGNIDIRTYLRTITSMSARDPHTLVVETTGPDPLLLNSISRVRIINQQFQNAATAEFNSGRAMIGTGPYRFGAYVAGSHVELARHDDWWGPGQPWDTVTIKMVTNPAARLAALLTGELDLIEDVPAQGRERIDADPALQVVSGISSRVVYFTMDQARDVTPFVTDRAGMPLERNPFKDRRVRQALSLAINRTGIVERVMEGRAIPATQFLPTGAPGTASELAMTPYDPNRAKALLTAAGYPDGFCLTLHGPNNRYQSDAKIVQAVAQMLVRIGIETKVEVMPWSVYAGRNTNGDFSMALNAWGVNTGETSNPLGAIIATADRASGQGVANNGRYSNKDVDLLLQRALHTMDDTARNKLLAEANAITFADFAILPLHHEVASWGIRKPLTYETRVDQYTLATSAGLAT